jgi:hypothetical protein
LRHTFTLGYLYELPFARLLGVNGRDGKLLLEGWQLHDAGLSRLLVIVVISNTRIVGIEGIEEGVEPVSVGGIVRIEPRKPEPVAEPSEAECIPEAELIPDRLRRASVAASPIWCFSHLQ